MMKAAQYPQRPTNSRQIVNKLMFINQMKVKYKKLVDKFQSFPMFRSKFSTNDKVSIASRIEYFAASWEPVDSYQDIVGDRYANSKHRILIGDPGYGKSTIALQYASDWCQNTQGTYLQDVEILIFLRLGQLRDVKSIYEAIRKFTLPKFSTLSEKDIKGLVENSANVLFILDAFDEYTKGKVPSDSDIMKIMKNEMLRNYKVIFTTGYLPEEWSPDTERFRLVGTDEGIQEDYICRTVASSDVTEASRIKKLVRENPVMTGMCQIPFFFVMYTNLCHHDKAIPRFNSVTNFVQYILDRFLSNPKKSRDYLKKYPSLREIDHKLDEIAFEGVFHKDRKITWGQMDMRNRLGVDMYNVYVESGILIEEEINTNPVRSGARPSHHRPIEVQFRHRIFYEWFAARYLALQGPKLGYQNFSEMLSKVSLCYDQYLYRFVCGFNRSVCHDIVRYVTKRLSSFTILCILELRGQIDDVMDIVNDFCFREIEIHKEQSKLLQEATVELLRVTVHKKIPVSRLRLKQIFGFVNLSSARRQFHLSLPPIKVSRLTIWEDGRVIKNSDLGEIFEYASNCIELQELRFSGCLLPKIIEEEILCLLQSTNIEVWWFPGLYRLDLESGRWEKRHLGGVMTDAEYWSEKQYVEQLQ